MTDRPRALAVLIAVFVLGCVLGSAGSYMWLRHSEPPSARNMRSFPAGSGPGRQRLPELLQMTPEQENQFREIMAESRKKLESLRTEQEPKIEAIRAETNRELLSVLNPDQQKKFDGFLKEMEQFRRRPPRERNGRGMQPPR